MAVELKVPEVGEAITEVQVGEWLVSVGDRVDRDQSVVGVETDKASVEIPAPVAGVLSEIVVEAGESATVGDVIGRIEEDGEAEETAEERQEEEAEEEKAEEPEEGREAENGEGEEEAGEPEAEEEAGKPREEEDEAEDEEEESEGDGKGDEESREDGGEPEVEPRVMPAARRLLDKHGLRADEVEGSGPGGRVLKEDVLRAAGELEEEEEPAAEEAEEKRAAKREDRQEEAVPMSLLRRRIAERLVQAQRDAALLTTFNEIDMSGVARLRRRLQERFQDEHGVKLGIMSFFVKASVDALKRYPRLNSRVDEDRIVYRNYYDIGIAVGGGKGLVVPVLRDADAMSFAEVEAAIHDLAARAQDNDLRPEELRGGTFTITNGGIYGSLLSTPIVNPPQSAILGMHAIQERPVAVDGEVEVRPMMYVALTYDHRVVDGREAVSFLRRIVEAVEDPARMLVEV